MQKSRQMFINCNNRLLASSSKLQKNTFFGGSGLGDFLSSGLVERSGSGFSPSAFNFALTSPDDLCGMEPVLMMPFSFSGLGNSTDLDKASEDAKVFGNLFYISINITAALRYCASRVDLWHV